MATPIRIHPRNSRLFDFRGEPRMLLCATEHYGAVINRPFRYERYIEDAAERSQTLTRLFMLFREQQSDRNPYSTCKPESTDYISPFPRSGPGRALDRLPSYDLTRWNPEFFDRLHGFLSLASSRGIIVEVTLLSNTYGDAVWALNPLNARNNGGATEEIRWWDYLTMRHPRLWAAQRAHLRKIVDEVNRYDNIILEVCNEPGGGVRESSAPPCAEVNAWQKEIVALIRETEAGLPNRHLVAGQEAFGYDPFDQTTDLSFDSMPFDIVNVHPLPHTTYRGRQYDMGEFMSGQLTLSALRDFCLETGGEAKPLNLDEDNVASRFRDPQGWTIHRKRAWTSAFCLRHYDVIDFSISPWCETGTPESRRHIRSWMGNLSRFLHSLDLARARPAPEAIRAVPEPTLAVALAVEAEEICVYLADRREIGEPGAGEPIRGEVTLDLPQARFLLACYSPESGLSSPWLELEGGRGTRIRLPELRHDLVLRLADAGTRGRT